MESRPQLSNPADADAATAANLRSIERFMSTDLPLFPTWRVSYAAVPGAPESIGHTTSPVYASTAEAVAEGAFSTFIYKAQPWTAIRAEVDGHFATNATGSIELTLCLRGPISSLFFTERITSRTPISPYTSFSGGNTGLVVPSGQYEAFLWIKLVGGATIALNPPSTALEFRVTEQPPFLTSGQAWT